MKRKIRYTDAPKEIQESMERGVDVTDWFHENFPQFRPEALAANPPQVKVTLGLGRDAVEFFKAQGKKLKVPYQRMIRNLIDRYAAAQMAWKVAAARPRGAAGKAARARKAK